jgi:hypothetical protein
MIGDHHGLEVALSDNPEWSPLADQFFGSVTFRALIVAVKFPEILIVNNQQRGILRYAACDFHPRRSRERNSFASCQGGKLAGEHNDLAGERSPGIAGGNRLN